MKNNFDPEIFDLEIDGRPYTFEFCREAILEADRMGVMSVDSSLQMLEIVFYAALKKHKPDITPSLAKRILANALGEHGDGDYDISSFGPLVDEFTRWYRMVFSGEGKKKIQPRSGKPLPKS